MIVQGVRVKVANLQRPPGQRWNDVWVFHQLPQHACPTFRRFIEQDFPPLARRRQGFGRQFPWFQLKVLLNRFGQGRLQAGHLLQRTRRFHPQH